MEPIFSHRSIRKYKNQPIDPKVLDQVLLAGTRASNTGNMQVYSMIVTLNQQIRQQLWEVHFKQPMVLQAPVHITFCADINRFNKWCEQRNADAGYDNFLWFMNASIDAVLASQNVCLEAENHGLGICYLGTTTYMAEQMIKILKLPEGVVPVTSIVLGYPDETPELTDRLPLEGVIHYETYQDYSKEDIDRIYSAKENSSLTKKLIEENKTQNLAQIFTNYPYKKEDNLHFSKEYLKTILRQGFMNH